MTALLAGDGEGCSQVVSCMWATCTGAISCLGARIDAHDFNGSACPSYMSCIESCQCDPDCLDGCQPDDNGSCVPCMESLFGCMVTNCPGPLQSCQLGGEGGAGGGGNGPTVLVSNINSNINDMAVDDQFVYFTTQQGLAKVSKLGPSIAMPLGGFPGASGIAIRGEFIYLVEDTGSVRRLKTDGTDVQSLVPSTFGGGSGAILLDSSNIFFSVGPYLRRAPIAGGDSTELTADVWQMGGPSSPRRIAMDTASLYYVGGDMGPGSVAELRMIDKMAAPATGTRLTGITGDVRAILASDGKIFYTELDSDGLTTNLEIKTLTPPSASFTVIASHIPTQGGVGGFLGAAFATDGTHLYFGGAPGLFSVSIADQTKRTLDFLPQPSAIAVDDEFVYYNDYAMNGSIKKIAKD